MMTFKTISIIIPAYNEASTILELLKQVNGADTRGLVKEIIVINDGSNDTTSQLVKKLKIPGLVLLEHPKNQGKGAAVRTGINASHGDIILIQDADLEYHPNEYPRLIEPFLKDKAQVVYGSREMSGTNRHSSALFHAGGRIVTAATNWLYGSQLTDVPTCYKAFRRETLLDLPLRCVRFEFCPEVTALLLRRKVPIIEIPIGYTARGKEAGKKIKVHDGAEAVWTLIRCRFVPVKKP